MSLSRLSHQILFSIILVLLLSACASQKQRVTFTDITHPKREFRGAWFSTAWQSRYRTKTPEQMKAYFTASLDQLQSYGINAIIFQVRPQADAFYRSELEPWSAHLTGKQGQAPAGNFDPLAFLIEECHKRNMELHAWLNPYRVTTTTNEKEELASSHLYYREPYRFVKYGGKIYFDPGIPANRKFICDVVQDIVSRYDVDAIHMDDYFYPYPIAGEEFPDNNSFAAYGRGYKAENKADWRRSNVNLLIEDIKYSIASVKPWVRFGISPFGIYRNKKSTPDGSGSETNGLQNYDDLYADVNLWTEKGWIDYNMPQLYWEIGHKAADYKTLIEWWAKHSNNRPLYIGQDVKRAMDAITPSGETQLQQKMILSRSFPALQGNCFWPAYELLDNYKGIGNELNNNYHLYSALIPAYTHMHDKLPKKVDKLTEEYTATTHALKWKSNSNNSNPETAHYYVVYRFAKGEKEDLDNASKITAVTRQTECILPYEGGKKEYKYVVTAVDAFHNESKGRSKKIKL